MKCKYCGHDIPDGVLYCEHCGKEVRIVPDYNPLDDVLAAQIKGSIDGTQTPLENYQYTKQESTTNTGQDRRKRRSEKKKTVRKRRRRIVLGVLAVVLILIGVLIFFLYRNSYSGQISQGNRAFSERNYEEAEKFYNSAIEKNRERPRAYTELVKTYIVQGKIDEAEEMLLAVNEEQPNNAELYQVTIQFYIDTQQEVKVSELLDDANDTIRSELSQYVSEEPEFSLDDSEPFDDVQQLSLTTVEESIYYTLDGTEPTAATATQYTDPIQIGEGETVVNAISVNAEGIPSLTRTRTYTVELPIEDAPAVTPSTGQYDTPTEISVTVPEGYTAYYTTDRSDPTIDSELYTGPISMPEGTTILKVVLINGRGRASAITTRNYELTLSE